VLISFNALQRIYLVTESNAIMENVLKAIETLLNYSDWIEEELKKIKEVNK
jgi:hypothetical protein